MTIPHLDDEALSAAVDGEATEAEAAHLARCPQCRAETETRAAVARAVGAPVTPPSPATVDAAIARALGVVPADIVDKPETIDVTRAIAGPAAAASLAPRPETKPQPAPHPAPRPASRPARWRDRAPSWALSAAGVAAAAVVLFGIVAVAGRLGTGHKSVSTSASSPYFSTTVAPRAAAGAASGASTTVPPVPGDLGSQTDAAVVAQLVTAAANAAASDNALSPSPTVPASLAAPVLTPCVAQAERAVGDTQASGIAKVLYSATLRWRGQPAVVVVLARPGGRSGVILSSADCSALVVLPL